MAPAARSGGAGRLRASCAEADGCATIRLAPPVGPPAQQARDILGALGGYARRAGQVRVIFLWAVSDVIGGTPLASAAAPADGEAGSGAVAALAEALDALPQLVVGLVDRPVGAAESCLFACCDAVHASAAAEFALAEDGAEGFASMPLVLLRRLGTAALAASAPSAPAAVCAWRAVELGLATEVVESTQRRWEGAVRAELREPCREACASAEGDG
ncbi:unnamed protein product [Prorocentrum cordatum]|uniref:Enoyl-CoA hydratase n=1 Tax=Prorocentrum cordatum TaxID=2364126 RepID=A0ABN9W2U7_9DINO|nr:unnamed protein product [Polarella glacialis]